VIGDWEDSELPDGDFGLDQIKEYIACNEWKFAKSMARIPHAYNLKERSTDSTIFEKFVVYIRANGYEKKFFSKTYIYLDIDGYSYWTMGSPLSRTKLINRAEIK